MIPIKDDCFNTEKQQKMQNMLFKFSYIQAQPMDLWSLVSFVLILKVLPSPKTLLTQNQNTLRILEDFQMVCKLGQGNYGEVNILVNYISLKNIWLLNLNNNVENLNQLNNSIEKVQQIYLVSILLHKPTSDYFAQKIHYVSYDVQESILKKKLKALIDCNSQYAVQCYGAFYSKGEIHIVMECMDMGSLQIILEKTKKYQNQQLCKQSKKFFKDWISLHTNKHLIQRDINNILINKKGEVKIGDFGICSVSENLDQKFDTFIGII